MAATRLAQPLAPVGQRRRPLLAPKHRVARPRRRSAELSGRDPADLCVEPRLLEDRLGEVGPGGIALGRDVVDAVRKEQDLARRRGEVTDVGRRPALIGDDRDLVPLLAEPQHRADEVRPRRPEEPGGAHDPGPLACSRFAVELRPPVRRLRVRPVRLHVRPALTAVEDVVGRVVDERRTEGGDVRSPADVDRGGALRIVLGAVDIRPGGRMEDDVGLFEPGGRRQLDVPVSARQGDHAVHGELLGERAAELPARAGD